MDVTVKVRDSIMPVELKTGKASLSLEHRGQVMLYVLMMQKFGYHVNSGLLFYLKYTFDFFTFTLLITTLAFSETAF